MRRLSVLCLVPALLVLCPLCAAAFTAEDILSPRDGTWANVQPLVLDVSDGSEVYYSLTGSNPLESGFSYDGPVLIDETGEVSLTITAVEPSGNRKDFFVSYRVEMPSVVFTDPAESLFIQAVSSNPIRRYVSGGSFSIPGRFLWCMGDPVLPDSRGSVLSISSENCLDRYVACTVTEGSALWRFVIHVVPSGSGEPLEEADVPFSIEEWDTFRFTGQKLIYQIDDEYWTASREPVTLDRSVPHVVRWQSMDYEFGNPVESFTLPARPVLECEGNPDGSCAFFVSDGGFLLGPAAELGQGSVTVRPGLSERLVADVFEDDSVYAVMRAGVWYGGVYQGDLSADFFVDRKVPQVPVISSSEKESYARNRVRLTISGDADADIYYAVSAPVESEAGFPGEISSVPSGDFTLYRKGSEIVLSSRSRNATYYKVSAFASDRAGNRSDVTEYHVVVDEFNFYLAPRGNGLNSLSVPDGSYSNPFTSFAEALSALEKSSYMRLHVLGDIELPAGDTLITTPCVITGDGARITVPENARIVIQDADFTAEGLLFERTARSYAEDAESRLFVIEGGSLTLVSCEVVGTFSADGILIDSSSALVSVEDSGLTVQGASYACVLACDGTAVTVSGSRLTSVAQVAVCLSVGSGTLLSDSSSLTVISSLGRCVELVDSVAHIERCSFSGRKESAGDACVAVWKDLDSVLDASGNEESGF